MTDTTDTTDAVKDGSSGPQRLVFEKIDALNDECKNLLTANLLMRLDDVLTDAGKHAQGPSEALIGMGRSLVHLLGYTTVKGAEQHEEWTATGDKRVDEVWDAYADLMRHMVITADDLDPAMRARFTAGEETDEDRAALKAMISERTGHDLSDTDVEIVMADSGPRKAAPVVDDSRGGTGQYL